MAIKCVLFDCDGVILDSMSVIYRSICHLCKISGVVAPKYETFLLEFDAPFGNYYQHLGVRLSKERSDEIFFGNLNQFYDSFEIRAFKEAEQTLLDLKRAGLKLGMISANTHVNLLDDLRQTGILSSFEIVTISPCEKEKSIVEATKALHIQKTETMYVGDLPIDMREAKKAGVWAVGSVGASSERKPLLLNAGADHTISHCGELPDLILRINSSRRTKIA